MPGIGIITNPHSKLNKRNPARKHLLGYIVGAHGKLEITNSLEDLGRVARDFLENNIEILAINGGDGTISRTLTAFTKIYGSQSLPKIAILRGGTINVLAENLKIKGSPEQILYQLTEQFSSDNEIQTVSLSSLKIEGNIGFLFGNGTVPTFLKEYYKRKSGKLGAAFWAFRVWISRFFGAKLYNSVVIDENFDVSANDYGPIKHQSIAILCSTIPRMPLNYPLFHAVKDKLNTIQLISFCFPAKEAIWLLPKTLLFFNRKSSKSKLALESQSFSIGLNKPQEYTLDGEIFTSKSEKVCIELGPTFEFVVT